MALEIKAGRVARREAEVAQREQVPILAFFRVSIAIAG